jgi:hypothetical protein
MTAFLILFLQLSPPLPAMTTTAAVADTSPVVRVLPHEPIRSVGFSTVGTDSTLRWERWWSPSERRSRETGVVSTRLTGFLRHDASLIQGFGPGRQRVRIDGVDLADPVTGLVNPHRIAHQNLALWEESGLGPVHRTRLEERDFYVAKPVTTIDYEQGAYNRRSTDVVFAANRSTRTGFAVRFWGKNDDGEYLGSPTSGRLMSARIYHHPDSVWKWVGQVRYHGLQTSEPDGYSIFNYIPQGTSPLNRGDASVRDLAVNLFARHRSDGMAGVHAGSYRRFYHGPADSSYHKVRSLGLYGIRHLDIGALRVDAGLRSAAFRTTADSTWLRSEVELDARLGAFVGGAVLVHNTDAGADPGLYAGMDVGWAHATVSAGDAYQRIDAGLRAWGFTLHAYLSSDDPDPGVSLEYRYRSPRWDLGASITGQNLADANDGARFWNRSWIYWSGFLFDRATFVKTGFHATLVPMGYHSPAYSPLNDQWTDGNRAGALIDPFYRIDYDLTARVRNLFLYLRYEHLNQNAGQFGYQETALYPMPGRHLRFGMKVVLRN